MSSTAFYPASEATPALSAATSAQAGSPGASLSSRRQFLLVWLAVSLVVSLAHFALSPRMGIYEDDHWLIGSPMCEWGVKDLFESWEDTFAKYFQGRPLCFAIGNTLAYASTHLGGMTGAFVLAAVIWSVNVGLCLALLWRRAGPVAATIAALVLALLPADTTQPMLHTAFYVHPSVSFLLLSGLAYARGRTILSLVFAAGMLLTYETCFLPALVWPILFPSANRWLWRRCLVHGLAMGVLLVSAVFVRMQLGESRVSGVVSDKQAVVKKVCELATVGPKTALKTFKDRPIATAKSWKTTEGFGRPGPSRRTVMLVSFGAGLAAFCALVIARRVAKPGAPPEAANSSASSHPEGKLDSGPTAGTFGRMLVSGALMVVLSYVAAVTREPAAVSGRMSSVHIAATLGWGVFFGALGGLVSYRLTRGWAGWVFAVGLGCYVCLLAGFHVGVQREYVRVWVAQGEFWQDVIAECPDVKSNTIILYPLGKPVSAMAHYQEWADHLVFRHLFVVPADWPGPPRAFPVGHLVWGGVPRDYKGYDWIEVEREGDRLYWQHWDGTRFPLEQGNVVLLQQAPDGRFERMTGTIHLKGVDLQLKPREGPTFSFEPNKLHPVMFPQGTQGDPTKRLTR